MRLLFVADGRSPITLSWLRYWLENGDEVHLVSTFPAEAPPGLASFHVLPTAFGGMAGAGSPLRRGGRLASLRPFLLSLRHALGPLSLPPRQRQFRRLVESLRPDLVHALRIPFEGMLACVTPPEISCLVSIWGNDLTLHARGSPLMAALTRRVLRRADALLADCERDIRLARLWGFDSTRPTLVVPGGGGIRAEIFHPPARPVEEAVIFNPRGIRAYVRSDTFFRAIPLVLERVPAARFLCAGMAGRPEALNWISKLGIENSVELLAPRPQTEMAEIYRKAMILVSPSTHDGTPNTLLEGMACGCFPIAGDLESIREWITDGENGLLIDPADPQALAAAILRGLNDAALRRRAVESNIALIAERAKYGRVMPRVREFYESVVRTR